MKRIGIALSMALCLSLLASSLTVACTSFIAGKKATADGSVLSTHNEDLRADTCQRGSTRQTFKDGEIRTRQRSSALGQVNTR